MYDEPTIRPTDLFEAGQNVNTPRGVGIVTDITGDEVTVQSGTSTSASPEHDAVPDWTETFPASELSSTDTEE